MENWWERFAGWVVAAVFGLASTIFSLMHHRDAQNLKDMRSEHEKLGGKVEKLADKVDVNKAVLADHATRLEVARVMVEATREAVVDIKESIGGINHRIGENHRELNEKIDRLLNRGN